MLIPKDYQHLVPSYLKESRSILKAEGINPLVSYHFFSDKNFYIESLEGFREIIERIRLTSKKDDIIAYSVEDGAECSPFDPFAIVIGRVLDLIEFEDMLHGSLESNIYGPPEIADSADFSVSTQYIRETLDLALPRDEVFFAGVKQFNMRDYEELDLILEKIGNSFNNQITFPSDSFIAAMVDKVGRNEALLNSVYKFGGNICPCGYNNKELKDLSSCLGGSFRTHSVILDTSFANVGEGAHEKKPVGMLSEIEHLKCAFGYGVTVSLAFAVRKRLDEEGNDVSVILPVRSSANGLEKLKDFLDAEKILGVKLFDKIILDFEDENVKRGVFFAGDIHEDFINMGETGMVGPSIVPVQRMGFRYNFNPRLKRMA